MTKIDRYIAALLFVATLGLYLYTMSPTIFWQDAGIYATGIYVEGNVYPPGYPFYLMLGIVWSNLIPIGLFVQKLQALSGVFSAISSVIIYYLIKNILNNKSTLYAKIKTVDREKDSQIKVNLGGNQISKRLLLSTGLSIAGSLLFALNYNVWSQAINVEVYALHGLFVNLILYLIIKIGEKGRIEKEINPKTIYYIYLTAICLGLSFGNHPMTIILVPTFLVLVLTQANILLHKKILIIATLITIVVASLTYLYLPIVANRQPVLNWGNPNSIDRFINHVTGKVYVTGDQSFVLTDLSRYQAALQEFVWEYSYLGILLAFAGAGIIYKQNKTLIALLSSLILFHLFFAIFYKQTTEYNSWLIPAHIATIILIVVSLHELILAAASQLQQNAKLKSISYFLPIALFVILWGAQTIQTANELNRREYYYAEDFGKNILGNLDKDSLIFLTGDQESATTMYLQSVLKYRTDVIAIKNIELNDFGSLEGRKLLKTRYPKLNIPEDQNTTFEQYSYIDQLVKANIATKSVYTMSKALVQLDETQFTFKPAAALWKIEYPKNNDALDLKYWNFHYHDKHYFTKNERPLMSLKDQSKPGGVNRVPFIRHMINFELQSWKNLGDWQFDHQQCQSALESYQKMEAIQPGITAQITSVTDNISQCTGDNSLQTHL